MSPQVKHKFFLFAPGLFLLLCLSVSASTNRPNEITTNGTADLIVNASGSQIIFERDLNLTQNLIWPGLLSYQNNDTLLWSNASNQDGRIIALEGRPLMPEIDAANITSGVIDVARLPDNSPFFNNVTLNISGLQDNIGVVTTNISQLWANASGVQSRIAALPIYYDNRWLIDGGIIASNISNGAGDVNITGDSFMRSLTYSEIDAGLSTWRRFNFSTDGGLSFGLLDRRSSNYSALLFSSNSISPTTFNYIFNNRKKSDGKPDGFSFVMTASSDAVYPYVDNTYNLGFALYRWKDLYYVTGHNGDQFYEGNNNTLIVTTEGEDGLYNVMIPRKDLPKGYEENSDLVRDFYNKNWASLKKVKQGYDGDVVSADGVSLKALDASIKVIDADAKSKADTVTALNAEIVSLKARIDKLEGVKP